MFVAAELVYQQKVCFFVCFLTLEHNRAQNTKKKKGEKIIKS